MKKRLIAILLTLVLVLGIGLVPTASAAEPTLESSVDMEQLIAHASSTYFWLEAGNNYGSVVPSDSGAVGMGMLGWRGAKALQLLKLICRADPTFSRNTLGDSLYEEVVSVPVLNDDLLVYYTYWSSRTFNSAEAAAARTLLSSQVGIEQQRYLARIDITEQAKRGWAQGIRTEAGLIYYCSVDNHYGPGGAQVFMRYVRLTMGITADDTINSLDQFHNAVVTAAQSYSYVNNTLDYRKKVYNYIKNTLKLDTTGTAAPAPSHDCPSAVFTDVPAEGHWAHEAIDYTVSRGLFNGTSATTFSPEMTMSRAMLVTVLYRLDGSKSVSGSSRFTDVAAGSFYENAVIWADQNAIVNGVSEDRFDPDAEVTREQIVTILFRYAQYAGNAGSLKAQTLTGYSDVDQVSDFAYYAMIWAIEQGLITGNGNNQLTPQSAATRMEVAVILLRFCQRG